MCPTEKQRTKSHLKTKSQSFDSFKSKFADLTKEKEISEIMIMT